MFILFVFKNNFKNIDLLKELKVLKEACPYNFIYDLEYWGPQMCFLISQLFSDNLVKKKIGIHL